MTLNIKLVFYFSIKVMFSKHKDYPTVCTIIPPV